MIELRNVKLPLSGGMAQGLAYDSQRLRSVAGRALRLDEDRVARATVLRRSVDARSKSDVHFVATVGVELAQATGSDEASVVERLADRNVVLHDEHPYEPPMFVGTVPNDPPVVVGAGAAGLFCALALAEAGLRPVLIERGKAPHERAEDVRRFERTGALDPESNIQFGAGGAGTFSDGKLTTGTTSPANAWVLRRFVEFGASPDILWQGKPHIGSDVLPGVVAAIAARIEACGGRVLWGTRMVDIVEEGGSVVAVEVGRLDGHGVRTVDRIDCSAAVLACGHSARDVFALLHDRGIALEPKVFSVGARIEHPQALVDRAQYGRAAGHPSLPPADYKLNWRDDQGRGAYTFCMCPGGTVVAAASEHGGVVTNGMSVFARDGVNANAALLVNVAPADIPGIEDDVLAGVAFQRRIERSAFEAGGGGYVAPAQLVGDFLAGAPTSTGGSVVPTYPRGVAWGDLRAVLPPFVSRTMAQAIPQLARKLRGFDLADAVLTGCETRSSSPVRVVRGDDLCSVSLPGLVPCGEGAGYAGGIMSASVDGLRCAQAVIDRLSSR